MKDRLIDCEGIKDFDACQNMLPSYNPSCMRVMGILTVRDINNPFYSKDSPICKDYQIWGQFYPSTPGKPSRLFIKIEGMMLSIRSFDSRGIYASLLKGSIDNRFNCSYKRTFEYLMACLAHPHTIFRGDE